jgi:hypothetical protein
LPIPEGLADRGVDQVVSLAGAAAQSSGFCRKSFAPRLMHNGCCGAVKCGGIAGKLRLN